MLDKELQARIIAQNRTFMKGNRADDPYEDAFESDQQLRLPQPPLTKPVMVPAKAPLPLSRDFSALPLQINLADLFRERRSARVYTKETMNLTQLSFLLWATQGVKALRGRAYATLRTVPSGGARHPFETYLLVRQIDGLEPGLYHYLPLTHALEYLNPIASWEDAVSDTLCGQRWAAKANVVFYWSMVAYRAEWRYGPYAHRVALIDMGHVGENLYLACAGLGLGTCGIGAIDDDACNRVFALDGQDEFMLYAAPVGTVQESDHAAEQAFYQFVIDENL